MIGKQILNYEIKSILGEGGMGTVYLAEHVKLGRKVAIKVLLPHLVKNELVRSRFINEAKLMASLHHPNIVTLYDYHEDENGLSLVMELVDGKPLDEYIQEVTGPIQEKEAIILMKQVLEGFGYAHKQGLIHRDIKPSNLIVTEAKEIKILDFGIAKLVGDLGNKLTKTGTHIGTVYYMSPEQVRGHELDLRSDIYALGITFYQMLTGICPYDGLTSEFDVFNKIVGEELPDPRSIYPGISEHMCHVIQKATAKKPDDRFQTCVAFIKGLKKDDFILSTETKNDISNPVKAAVGNVAVEDKVKKDGSSPELAVEDNIVIKDKTTEIESQKEPLPIEEKNEKQENSESKEKPFVSHSVVSDLKDSNRNKKLNINAIVGLIALFIIIGIILNSNKKETTSDDLTQREKESKSINEKEPEAEINASETKPKERNIESQKSANSNSNNEKTTDIETDEDFDLEVEKMIDSEKMNPLEYLNFSHDGGRKNFIDDIKIFINISNNANFTDYNNFLLEITYYDKNGDFKGSANKIINTTIHPGYKIRQELKFTPPFGVKSVDMQLLNASPIN